MPISTPSRGVPAGTIVYVSTDTPRVGFLRCNGAEVSRTTYGALFAAIGTSYGAGNGTTTFNVPDLRGEFIRGWDNGRGVDSGRAFGSAQTDQNKQHAHWTVADTTSGGFPPRNDFPIGSTVGGSNEFSLRWGSASATLGSTNAEGGAETRPRNIALLACIKF